MEAMPDLPRSRANRLARARWLDARLLAGLLLVLLSVVVGAKVIGDADHRVQVWSVSRDLGVGTTLTAGDVRATSVNLDTATGRYLSAGQVLEGLVLTRPLGRGELLPASAVVRGGADGLRRIVIEVGRVGVTGLSKGRVVDVYVVPEAASGETPAPPTLVLPGVTVAEDVRAGNGFGGSGSTAGVALLVQEAQVSALIGAVAHGEVYLVQVPVGAPAPSSASAQGL